MKIIILLLLLTSCSFNKTSDLNNKKILNFDNDYTFTEFSIILEIFFAIALEFVVVDII